MAPLMVSILLPSLARAREQARRTVGAANLKNIGMACHMYAADHQDKFPDDFQTLIDEGLLDPKLLISPRDDGGATCSFILIPDQKATNDPRNVLAYEKLISDEGTNALFADGHVQWLNGDGFKEHLRQTCQRLHRAMPDDINDQAAWKLEKDIIYP
jgi:prepilin-type processing-associated H-X9-DG protein